MKRPVRSGHVEGVCFAIAFALTKSLEVRSVPAELRWVEIDGFLSELRIRLAGARDVRMGPLDFLDSPRGRARKGGAELFEKEIEDLLWANLEEFTGEVLFPVKQQAKLPSGGTPDIVALDKSGRVVVFEVKRDVDRRQLAQCLEYAGWARTANLGELAGLYHGGQQGFWSDWQDFTDSATPVVVNPNPRLVLVARDFQQRTESAFEFLVENRVPVTLVRVTIYVDESGRRFVDVEGDHEIEISAGGEQKDKTTDYTRINGKPIKLADLLDAGRLEEGEPLEGPSLGIGR